MFFQVRSGQVTRVHVPKLAQYLSKFQSCGIQDSFSRTTPVGQIFIFTKTSIIH